MGKGRVLIIEDESMVSLLLEDIISEAGGQTVGVVESIAMGMAVLNEENFDLVILDVNLHGETSEPLVAILKRAKANVIVSTGTHPSTLPAAFSDFEVAQKPFHMNEMIEKIRRLAF